MENRVFSPGAILLPSKDTDIKKWSVVACDQYTSEPEYWDAVSSFVGNSPSTLHLTLPEIYLESGDTSERIASINSNMNDYISSGVFSSAVSKYIYVERTQRDGKVRRGLMGVVDLMEYDYLPTSQTKIRATEGTVISRIPPRVRVRENAPLELPHIMLLIDDREKSVIEPIAKVASKLTVAYDSPLMQDSGHIRGFFVSEDEEKRIDKALAILGDKDAFEKKYDVSGKGVLQFAVGDGNHSLATAKECFNRIKDGLSESEWKNHPARYALVELVNLHDSALEFDAIHRVVFDVNPEHLLASLYEEYQISDNAEQTFSVITADGKKKIGIANPSSNLTVGTLQKFLDKYIDKNGGRVDYIHGADVVERLGSEPGNIGFLLPVIEKNDLFPTVIRDGVLPRKAFSMGHAWDKRFYLEARRISKNS